MCGRFVQYNLARVFSEEIEEKKIIPKIDIQNISDFYNLSPTQNVIALKKQDKETSLEMFHWGLIPSWSKDKTMSVKMINARAETITEKPSFKKPFLSTRCLIPANGFYEWKKEGKSKQPYYIKPKNEEIFYFAGLWDIWKNGGQAIQSCTIITTVANELLRPIHDKNRMPVILDKQDCLHWMDENITTEKRLTLLKPYSAKNLIAYPVHTYVNRSSYDEENCILEMK